MGWLGLALGIAFAQEAGTVDGIVFDARGVPLADRVVRIGDVVVITDALGGFRASAPAGDVVVSVDAHDRVGTIPVVAGRQTELLLTQTADGAWYALAEAPVTDTAPAPQETGPKGPLRGIVRAESGAPLK